VASEGLGLDAVRDRLYYYATPFGRGDGPHLHRIDIRTGENRDLGLVARADLKVDWSPAPGSNFDSDRGREMYLAHVRDPAGQKVVVGRRSGDATQESPEADPKHFPGPLTASREPDVCRSLARGGGSRGTNATTHELAQRLPTSPAKRRPTSGRGDCPRAGWNPGSPSGDAADQSSSSRQHLERL
jgi:hypothetical protein